MLHITLIFRKQPHENTMARMMAKAKRIWILMIKVDKLFPLFRCISSYLSALPTIQVHPELNGRTPDIVHCFYNIAGHFPRWKVAFSALIKLQILHVYAHVHVHELFSLAALFAARARARVVFTCSTSALLICRRFWCFYNHFKHVFQIFKVTEKP